MSRVWPAALWLLAAVPRLAAQGQIELTRLAAPVRVDGELTDSAWVLVEPLPLTMHAPAFRGRPAERTEIRVAYDDQYLYASGRFYDSRPGEIRINSLYRDRWSGDYTFALFVDPAGTRSTTGSASTSGCATISGKAAISGWYTTKASIPSATPDRVSPGCRSRSPACCG